MPVTLAVQPSFSIDASLGGSFGFASSAIALPGTPSADAMLRVCNLGSCHIAVALGNGPATAEAVHALRQRLDHPDAMVREHVTWALAQLTEAVKTETKHDP